VPNFLHYEYNIGTMLNQSERITSAASVIEFLLRARKAVRLYPDQSPVTENAIKELYQEIMKLLSLQDRIAFEVREDSVLFEMEEVFKSGSAENDIANFLFRDGIREISFRKGLTLDEVLRLVHVTSMDFGYETAVEDAVTRIWDQDFSHIRCIIYEPTLFDSPGSKDAVVEERRRGGDFSAELKRVYKDAAGKGDEECIAPDVMDLSDRDLLELKKEVDNSKLDRTGRLLTITLELFLLAEPDEYYKLETAMKQAVEYTLSKKKLDVLADFFIRVKTAYMDYSRDPVFKRSLLRIFSYFSSEKFLIHVGSLLDEGFRLDDDTFKKLTQLLDARSIPVLIRLLGYMDTISARKTVVNMLVVLGSADMSALTAALYDSRWYVVRNMVIVLRRIGDSQAKRHLLAITEHKDARVRREAVKALAEIGCNEVTELLRRALDDPDLSVRQFALGSLSNIDRDLAKELLFHKIRSRKFHALGYAEKRDYYTTLMQFGGSDVIRYLSSMLMKESFFNSSRNAENRAAIAYCMGVKGAKEFLPGLLRISNHKNGLLRRIAQEAIRKIENEP
jgi:HEAT repeat protein